jgi:hypothetical protein
MLENEFWKKQRVDKPLFPDLLWSRPEHQAQAGKLLIIGGNLYGFSAPADAYRIASEAGIGTTHVLLPDALKRTVGRVLAAGDFTVSTPSGSFSQKALPEIISQASWADGVLLAGDLGHNSETAILLEKCLEHYHGQLTLTKDAVDYFVAAPGRLLERAGTTIVVSFAQLQKMAVHARYTKPFTFDIGLVRLVGLLHEFSKAHAANIVVKHLEEIVVAVGGRVSTTRLIEDAPLWRLRTATFASVWWLQNPDKSFEALTSAVYESFRQ